MGEAKRRGSFEQRKKEAIDKRAKETAEITMRGRQQGKSKAGALALWSTMLAVTGGVDITQRGRKEEL